MNAEPNRIVGTLDAFFETGSEGIYWVILDNSKTGYDALNILEDGDYLFVENGDRGIEWEGKINLDHDMLKQPLPLAPHLICQRVAGCTVHGVQVGVDSTVWFDWFSTNRPAVVIKGVK